MRAVTSRWRPGAARRERDAARPAPVVTEPRRGPRAPLPFLDPQEGLGGEEVAAVHMAAAVLLAYPDGSWDDGAAAVREVASALPGDVGRDLTAFLDAVAAWDAAELAAHHVAIFDLKRRCTLHLSYYSSGDTRRRGMALVTFGEAFRASGFEVGPDELPDHLPLVLELTARGGEVADLLLASHRQGVELLRTALHQARTPYAHVLDAVCRTLPEISDDAVARFTELLSQGPPSEVVGLATPLLPFPTVRSEAS